MSSDRNAFRVMQRQKNSRIKALKGLDKALPKQKKKKEKICLEQAMSRELNVDKEKIAEFLEPEEIEIDPVSGLPRLKGEMMQDVDLCDKVKKYHESHERALLCQLYAAEAIGVLVQQMRDFKVIKPSIAQNSAKAILEFSQPDKDLMR